MTIKVKLLLAISCTLFAGSIIYLLLPPHIPLSPLSLISPQPLANSHKPYTILGFLPYWNLKRFTSEAESSVTHLAYFTLHLGDTGELVKLEKPGQEDPGYTNYKRLLAKRESCSPNYASANYDDSQITINQPCNPLILTFMPYDQDTLNSILVSPANRNRAISTIKNLLEESQATGVNIDFEPTGTVPPSLRDSFTLFIKDLSQQLSTTNHVLLSISIYPSAAAKPRLWDLANLAPLSDYFVVMTYDYTMPGSLKTGPNSPLRGAGELFEHDILKNLAEITKLVPSEKILLGIPFYGYEWTADNSDKYTPTVSRASVASLERIKELIDENTLEILWDRNSLTPYAIRREEGEIVSQIYYESVDSIKLKLELVKSASLGGIAIWALGYEGDNPELWDLIRSLNTP